MKPLAIDLFCGLGGWAEGFLSEGYEVIGFDIEARPYPGRLVLQDVLTLHGSQFRNVACIVASPPCQAYSYMAMPWKRAKAMAGQILADTSGESLKRLNALFDACFRIQREANYATGFLCDTCEHSGACPSCWDMPRNYIPMVVENVKGAQPWVGPARTHFGSFYLWGDIESIGRRIVRKGPVSFGLSALAAPNRTGGKQNPDGTEYPQGSWFKIADSKNRGSSKNNGGSWFNQAHNTESGHGQNPDGRKVPGLNWSGSDKPGYVARAFNTTAGQRVKGSRAQASAKIAMIPPPLAEYIARVFKPANAPTREAVNP